MERILDIHIEKLADGVYLATSDAVPGLVAQSRTIAETLEIARDIGRGDLASSVDTASATPATPSPHG